MQKKLCAQCGKSFLPRPQTPDQSYCSEPKCQKARHKRWVDEKRKSDFIDVLNLVLAKGYLVRLLENNSVARYIKQNQPDVFSEFATIVQTVSMDK